jgi:hypothetical protein
VIDAVDMAIWNRRPAQGLVHHSDQGCQYTSLAFGRRLREAGLVASMGSVGDCFDNAVTESFFATLECELLDRTRFATRSQPERPSSTTWRASTTPAGATPPWAISAPLTSRGGTPPATLPPDLPVPRCLPHRGNSNRHVIATLWPIGDRPAVRIAKDIYEGLAARSAEEVAWALHQATRRRRDQDARRPSTWAAHIHSGA